jgi:uncharacterized protein DUF6285
MSAAGEAKRSQDVPDAADLLATARDTLVDELLPALPGERRYTALMIANAMAIAARELALGAQATRREIERLRPFAAQEVAPSDPGEDDVHALRRSVAAAIRDGRFDDDAHAEALQASLFDIAVDRLAISNPKAVRD